MHLTDVKIIMKDGKIYLSRVNKRGKMTQKIDVSRDVADIVVRSFKGNMLLHDHNGKAFLMAIREASKEDLAVMKLENEKEAILADTRGKKAAIRLQRMLMGLFGAKVYDTERTREINLMKEFIKETRRRKNG